MAVIVVAAVFFNALMKRVEPALRRRRERP
jgi:hypothetical protein